MTALSLPSDLILPPPRGRGRPRKPVVPKPPARPAHRPRVGFLDNPARFAVAIAYWLNAGGLRWAWAKEVGAIIADPQSVIGHMPRRDAKLIDLALRHRHLAGNMAVVMVMSPDLEEDEAVVSPTRRSAIRRIERALKRLDAGATRWLLRSATAIQLLRARSPHARAIAHTLLLAEGWSEWLVERISPVDR